MMMYWSWSWCLLILVLMSASEPDPDGKDREKSSDSTGVEPNRIPRSFAPYQRLQWGFFLRDDAGHYLMKGKTIFLGFAHYWLYENIVNIVSLTI